MTRFQEILRKPRGLVLVVGPTGSGKSTTIASLIEEINRTRAERIVTIEDPVEYVFESKQSVITQRTVGEDVPTFPHGLRSAFREDLDVLLIGETRDLETAEISIQASLTGHIVFTTLHTNDAPSAITRLRDMGLPTFLITATVEAVLAPWWNRGIARGNAIQAGAGQRLGGEAPRRHRRQRFDRVQFVRGPPHRYLLVAPRSECHAPRPLPCGLSGLRCAGARSEAGATRLAIGRTLCYE